MVLKRGRTLQGTQSKQLKSGSHSGPMMIHKYRPETSNSEASGKQKAQYLWGLFAPGEGLLVNGNSSSISNAWLLQQAAAAPLPACSSAPLHPQPALHQHQHHPFHSSALHQQQQGTHPHLVLDQPSIHGAPPLPDTPPPPLPPSTPATHLGNTRLRTTHLNITHLGTRPLAPPLPLSPPPPLPPYTPSLSVSRAAARSATGGTLTSASAPPLPLTPPPPLPPYTPALSAAKAHPPARPAAGAHMSKEPTAQAPRRSARLKVATLPPSAPAPSGINSGANSKSNSANKSSSACTKNRRSRPGTNSGRAQPANPPPAQAHAPRAQGDMPALVTPPAQLHVPSSGLRVPKLKAGGAAQSSARTSSASMLAAAAAAPLEETCDDVAAHPIDGCTGGEAAQQTRSDAAVVASAASDALHSAHAGAQLQPLPGPCACSEPGSQQHSMCAAHTVAQPQSPHHACSEPESQHPQHPQTPQLPNHPHVKPTRCHAQSPACTPPEMSSQQPQYPQTYARQPASSHPCLESQNALQPFCAEEDEVESVYGSAVSSPVGSKAVSRATSEAHSEGELENGEVQVLDEDGTWRAVLEVGAGASKNGMQGEELKCSKGNGAEGFVAFNAPQQQQQQQNRKGRHGDEEQQEEGNEDLEEGEVLPTPAKTGISLPSKHSGVTDETVCGIHVGSEACAAGNAGFASIPVLGNSAPGRAGVQAEDEVIVISDSEDDLAKSSDLEADRRSAASALDQRGQEDDTLWTWGGQDQRRKEQRVFAHGGGDQKKRQLQQQKEKEKDDKKEDDLCVQNRGRSRPLKQQQQQQQRRQQQQENLVDAWDSDDGQCVHVVSTRQSQKGEKGSRIQVDRKQEREVEDLQMQLQQLKQQRQEQQEQLERLRQQQQQQQQASTISEASSGQNGSREGKNAGPEDSGGSTAVEESRFLVPDTNVLMHSLDTLQLWTEVNARSRSKRRAMLLIAKAVMLELDGLKKNKLVGALAREAARMLEQVQSQKMLQLQRDEEWDTQVPSRCGESLGSSSASSSRSGMENSSSLSSSAGRTRRRGNISRGKSGAEDFADVWQQQPDIYSLGSRENEHPYSLPSPDTSAYSGSTACPSDAPGYNSSHAAAFSTGCGSSSSIFRPTGVAGLSSRAMTHTRGMSTIPSTTTTSAARPDVLAWQQQQQQQYLRQGSSSWYQGQCGLWQRRQMEAMRREMERLEARFRMPSGDDGVLACCRWFSRQPGGHVMLVSEDRILRLRATDEGLDACMSHELRAAAKHGKHWFS